MAQSAAFIRAQPSHLSSTSCLADCSLLGASSSGCTAKEPPSRVRLARVRASTVPEKEVVSTERGSTYQGKLRLFMDSADVDIWRHWLPSGAFYGVTTNPILLEKARVTCQLKPLAVLAKKAFQLGAKEVQLQTWGVTVWDMVATGTELANINPSIVVKIPLTKTGLEAASRLINQGARVTMTGVYSVHQVLLAAGVGAAYAAPYLGRMIALGKTGEEDIQEMQRIVRGVNSEMRLLVASIKSVEQITSLAAKGVNSFAVPDAIVKELFGDPNTEKAASDFEESVTRNSYKLFL